MTLPATGPRLRPEPREVPVVPTIWPRLPASYDGAVEIDQFIADHQHEWQRLETLARSGRRRRSKLSPEQADELLELYDVVSAHLSTARTHFDDQTLNDALSQLLGFARGLIYRPRRRPRNGLWTFLAVIFPAAAWQTRRFVVLAAVVMLAPAVATGAWLTGNAEVRNSTIDPRLQEILADRGFEDYYSSEPAEAWAFELFTHNIEVTALAFAAGAVLVLGAWVLLFQNGLAIGTTAAVMYSAGKGSLFWGLVVPHGLLELSSIFLGAGAGMAIGWAIIAPGDRSRAEAISATGMRSAVVMLGAMLCLVVAGATEAFVTPSGLPTGARVGVGVAWFVGLVAWVVVAGSRAVALGATGTFRDLTDELVPLDQRTPRIFQLM